MGSLKRDHNLLWPGDKRGEYCLLPTAIRHVEKMLALETTVGEETVPKADRPETPTPKATPSRNPGATPQTDAGPASPGKAKFESLFRAGISRTSDEEQ
jgi:hypothetical protein